MGWNVLLEPTIYVHPSQRVVSDLAHGRWTTREWIDTYGSHGHEPTHKTVLVSRRVFKRRAHQN